MVSDALQTFNERVAGSAEVQAKLSAVTSPIEVLAIAKSEGCDLTPADFQALAHQAYQAYVERLDPTMSQFFRHIHGDKALNDQLKTCQSSAEAIALAHQCGLEISEVDLQNAAAIAESVSGFSFEKLWFRQLGIS